MVKVDKKNSLFLTGVVIANGIADSDGDILDKKDIKKLVSSYLSQKTDTNHDFLENFGVKIIENYVSEKDETIGDKKVPSGSWICKMMIWDEDLKHAIRQGKYTGLSLASQPDTTSNETVLNKRHTYKDFKDVEELTPSFISIVKNPANGYKFDYYSYESYITKSKELEVKSVSEEIQEEKMQETEMSVLANKLVDAILQQNNVLKNAVIKSDKTEENGETVEEKTENKETVTKAAPPQGGIAPQQPQGQPQYGQPVSLEMINQKLDHILQIVGGGQQPMKSSENDESNDSLDKAEEKTNDETKEPEKEEHDNHDTGQVSTDGKDDVKPSTETEGSVPSSGKKKQVLKSEAPKTEHVENVNTTSNIYTQKNVAPIHATPRDMMGRPIRD